MTICILTMTTTLWKTAAAATVIPPWPVEKMEKKALSPLKRLISSWRTQVLTCNGQVQNSHINPSLDQA